MSLAIGPRCRTLARLSSWTRARPSPSPLPSLSGLTGQANDAQTVCRRRGRGHGHGNREYSCLISPSRVPRPTIIPPSQPRSSSSSPPSQPVCPATPLCRNTQVSSFSTARSLKHSSGIVSSRKLDGENYHALADDYLDTLVEKLEEMQEARPDLEVEYSVCLDLQSTATPCILVLQYIIYLHFFLVIFYI